MKILFIFLKLITANVTFSSLISSELYVEAVFRAKKSREARTGAASSSAGRAQNYCMVAALRTVVGVPRTVAAVLRDAEAALRTVAGVPRTAAAALRTVADAPRIVAAVIRTVAAALRTVEVAQRTVEAAQNCGSRTQNCKCVAPVLRTAAAEFFNCFVSL